MSLGWVLVLPLGSAETLAPLRLEPKLELAVDQQTLWLRGPVADEDLQHRLRCLPADARYDLLPDGQLRLQGMRVPTAKLPKLNWQPLGTWLLWDLPQLGFGAQQLPRISFEFGTAAATDEPAALLTSFTDWTDYARTAPLVRLKPLRFAVAADGRVLVRGRPLPPLPGQRLQDVEGILIPCGQQWLPPVEAAVVRAVLDLTAADVALWLSAAQFERIAADQFVQATRSAVRATFAGATASLGRP